MMEKMDTSCNNCLYHHLSMKYEADPDNGSIGERICSGCGSGHGFFIENILHPGIAKLGQFFQEHLPHEICDGGAVDNAIRLLGNYFIPAREAEKNTAPTKI